MVKKTVVGIVYFIFFIFMLIYFISKVDMYYFLEDRLDSYNVIISDEKLADNGFTLSVENASVYFDSIESAKVSNAKIAIFGFYNFININDITLASVAKSFIPLHIDRLDIKYSVFNPFVVHGYSSGQFGKAKLSFNIQDNKLHIDLKPSDNMLKNYKTTLKGLKKSNKGEFIYDKTL